MPRDKKRWTENWPEESHIEPYRYGDVYLHYNTYLRKMISLESLLFIRGEIQCFSLKTWGNKGYK